MRAILSSGGLISLTIVALWIGTGFYIAGELEENPVHIALVRALIPVIPLIIVTVPRIPWVRLGIFKMRNSIFGPTYHIQAGGTLQTSLSVSDQDVLNGGLRTAQKVYDKAKAEVLLDNRLIISGSTSRTILLDVFHREDENDEADTEVRAVETTLRGYEGKSARIATLVEDEIVPFFYRLSSEIQADDEGQNFWLQITLPSRNPFLEFYLQDVPNADVSKFQLEFTQELAGDKVNVTIQKDGFRVNALTPRPFVKTVRTYLHTPALADSNRPHL